MTRQNTALAVVFVIAAVCAGGMFVYEEVTPVDNIYACPHCGCPMGHTDGEVLIQGVPVARVAVCKPGVGFGKKDEHRWPVWYDGWQAEVHKYTGQWLELEDYRVGYCTSPRKSEYARENPRFYPGGKDYL